MKNSPLTTVLLVILVLSALASVALCYECISGSRELRQIQANMISIQNNRTFIAQLAKDAFDYSQKDHAIDPILEAAGVLPAKSPPAAATTTTKPSK